VCAGYPEINEVHRTSCPQKAKENDMAWLEEHCEETEKALGKPYREVHLWLDEFFRSKEYGHDTGGCDIMNRVFRK